ncbi:MAG: LLM class flavin-dependent oxidoreductase [Myxococcota bacterium]
MKLGVVFGWHCLAWEDLLALVMRAEALGYAAAYHDGDITQLGQRQDTEVLDGWTVTTSLVARTERIGVGSIRLVQHWNAARLAQAAATLERIAPGRLQFFASIGDRPEDPAWGIPRLSPAERIAFLDETLGAVRALWRGEAVECDGAYVRLDRARVRPVLGAGAPAIELGAKGPKLLELVARHADIWNVNWPPIPDRVAASADTLAAACGRAGRDPDAIRRRMWVFARAQRLGSAEALAEFRRWNPWFAHLPDAEVTPSLVTGTPAECADQLRHWGSQLRLEMAVVDLSGLDAGAARETLEAFPGGTIR